MFNTDLLPTPKRIKVLDGSVQISSVVSDNAAWDAQVKAITETVSSLGLLTDGGKNAEAVKDDTLQDGEYILKSSESGVLLRASGEKGVCHAFAALLQLLLTNDGVVPCCEIQDKPDCSHRGMMVDLARTWHPFSYLLSYVDLCAYYRCTTLHLHFTDDQSYTLPSAVFPNLPSINRHYSFEEIRYLGEYAKARGIQIMPEIDVPGHCTPFREKYPEIFGTESVVGFTPEVFDAFDKLLTELCQMFPASEKIHIGGDEAHTMSWTQNPAYMEYAESLGMPCPHDGYDHERMLALFITQLANTVLRNGKTPVAWEGFNKVVNDMVSKDITIISWENMYQLAPDLAEHGYTLINCSWVPMYIVYPRRYWSLEDVYNWNIYRFEGVNGKSPYRKAPMTLDPYDKMTGGQILAWGDCLPGDKENLDAERNMLAEHLAALAQNTWNVEKVDDFEKFSAVFAEIGKGAEKIIALSDGN